MMDCLWVLGTETIYGISIDHLKQLGRDDPNQEVIDWNSLPHFPSDFLLFDSVPESRLRPLPHGSKLFLGFGEQSGSEFLSSKIYRLAFHHDDEDSHNNNNNNNKKLLPLISEPPPDDSIPTLPDPAFCHSPFTVHAEGKLYFLAYNNESEGGNHESWVLEPGTREWRPLEPPPPVANLEFKNRTPTINPDFYPPQFFAVHEKLFFRDFHSDEKKYHLYGFDNEAKKWYEMDAKSELEPLIMAVPLPLPLPNRMVAIAWKNYEDTRRHLYAKFYALLLDSKDCSVLRKQQLDEFFLGTRNPTFEGWDDVQFIDIGNGHVCALMDVFRDAPDPIVWVLVFSVSCSSKEVEAERFVEVDVLVNRLFLLPGRLKESLYPELLRHTVVFSHREDDEANSGDTYDTCSRRKREKKAPKWLEDFVR